MVRMMNARRPRILPRSSFTPMAMTPPTVRANVDNRGACGWIVAVISAIVAPYAADTDS